MPRADGFTDYADTIQGVRSYDSNAGTWSGPDSYGGQVGIPASQKAYLWLGGDPNMYQDPSGFNTICVNAPIPQGQQHDGQPPVIAHQVCYNDGLRQELPDMWWGINNFKGRGVPLVPPGWIANPIPTKPVSTRCQALLGEYAASVADFDQVFGFREAEATRKAADAYRESSASLSSAGGRRGTIGAASRGITALDALAIVLGYVSQGIAAFSPGRSRDAIAADLRRNGCPTPQ